VKRQFLDQQRPHLLRHIEARDDVDGNVESDLRCGEVVLCGVRTCIHNGGDWSNKGWQQLRGDRLRVGVTPWRRMSQEQRGTQRVHPEGAGLAVTRADTPEAPVQQRPEGWTKGALAAPGHREQRCALGAPS
jgi:hypothetical protein